MACPTPRHTGSTVQDFSFLRGLRIIDVAGLTITPLHHLKHLQGSSSYRSHVIYMTYLLDERAPDSGRQAPADRANPDKGLDAFRKAEVRPVEQPQKCLP